MPPNETSALLKNYHTHPYTSVCNNNTLVSASGGYHAVDDNNHVVYVNKDVTEYEPILCLNEYSSSLTLDELLPYKFDPWWQNLRRTLLFICWLMFLLMLSAACLLSYLQAGQASCHILDKHMPSSSIEMFNSPASSISSATTTFPSTFAKVLPADFLGGVK